MIKTGNSKLFLYGIGVGIGFVLFFIFNTFIFYKIGNMLFEKLESGIANRKFEQIKEFVSNFDLNFEKNGHSAIFSGDQSGLSVVEDSKNSGNHQLLVEFPAGSSYPGIIFELSGKNTMDWSSIKELTFDVFDSISSPAKLTVKLKSGDKYPKRSFEKDFIIPPQQLITCRVSLEEIIGQIDLRSVSYIKIFMQDPETTFFMYFDNIRTVK